MQLAARKALDPDQTIVVVLTSGGLKDPGASRTWLPPVPTRRPTSTACSASCASSTAARRMEPAGRPARASLSWAPTCRRASPRGRAPPSAAGLGSLWIIEDYFHPGAYALAAAAAAVTERIAIGLGVVNPYTRHPALLAMETAALAGIAPGRVVLGLGSSNRRWIEAQMGIPFKAPLGGLRESVEIVRRLLAGERVTLPR